MQNKITCSQIHALINFYKENTLNPKLKDIIDEHLAACPECRQLYAEFGIVLNNFGFTNTNEIFTTNLSAYMDNEMSPNESVKFKKTTISNPITKKEMESMYALKRAIQLSVDKTKNDFKNDYSKNIIGILSGKHTINPFKKLAWTFAGMMSAIVLGFLVLSKLYF